MSQQQDYILGRDVTEQAQARESRGTVVVSFRISANEFDALSDIADGQGKTVSQVAREAFRHGLTSRGPTQWAAMSFAGGNMVYFGNAENSTFGAEEADLEGGDQESDRFRILSQKTV